MSEHSEYWTEVGHSLAEQCWTACTATAATLKGTVLLHKLPKWESEFFVATTWEPGYWFNLTDAHSLAPETMSEVDWIRLGLAAEWTRLREGAQWQSSPPPSAPK